MEDTEFNARNYFHWALFLSFLAHSVLLFSLKTGREIARASTISVNLVELPQTKVPKQIVSPPELQNNQVPTQNSNLSDRDNSTTQETIKRGMGGGIPGAKKEGAKTQRSIKKEFRLSQKKELVLSDRDLLNKYSASPQENQKSNQDVAQQQPKEFSRAAGTGAAFFGTRGIPDYLPQLPDGDLTLLNTKASQFAVFVRRVATRVFGEMRQAGWDYLLASDIYKIQEMVTVEAVIGIEGDLIKALIVESSGSSKFDEVLLSAVKKGVADKNPPPTAIAEDGNIHFTFKSRSWTRPAMSRSGLPSEQRWLLLGTGLK